MELLKWIFWWMVAAAAGGLLITLLTAMKVRYPSWLRLAHGGLAFAGLVPLAFTLYGDGLDVSSIPQSAFWALGLLVAAFLGGSLFFGVLFRKAKPWWAIVGHAGLALAGIVALFMAVY